MGMRAIASLSRLSLLNAYSQYTPPIVKTLRAGYLRVESTRFLPHSVLGSVDVATQISLTPQSQG